jgi:hypothetical protein
MATAALKSRGTKIQVDTGGGSFADIPEAKDIQFPAATVDEIDVTNQDSPSNSKEFVAGDVDFGTVTFSCNYLYNNARHVALIADQAAGTKRDYRVLLVGGVLAVQFNAYVQSVTRQGPVSGVYTIDVTLRVTGQPTEDTTP